MKGTSTKLLVLLLLAGMGWLGWRMWHTEEHAVRRCLDRLVAWCSFEPGESLLAKAAALERLRGCLTRDVTVHVRLETGEDYHLEGRPELMETIKAMRAHLKGLRLRISEVTVGLSTDHQTARAEFVLEYQVYGAKEPSAEELRVDLKKENGEWRVVTVENVPVLQR